MKITRECDYAIRILLMLSALEDGEIAGASSISETQCVPKQFTLKILRELMAAEFVISYKGIKGGYGMGKTPAEISLLDIITAIDGEIAINECLECGHRCNRVSDMDDCPVHRQMKSLNNLIVDKLSNITLENLIKNL